MEKQGFLARIGNLIAKFDTAVFVLIVSLVFLLPIFFVPSLAVPFHVSKLLLLGVFVALAFILWLSARIRDGVFAIPKHKFLWAAVLIPVVTLVAALMSANPKISLIGTGTDMTAFSFVLLSFVLMFLVAVTANTKRRILYFYLSFLASLAIVALFHLVRIIPGVDFLNLTLLTDRTSNLIGKWNDFGVFFGLALIFSLVTIEFMALTKQLKVLTYVVLIISLFFLALVGFPLIWIVVGLFSLFLFVYRMRIDKKAVQQDVVTGDGEVISPKSPGVLSRTWHSLLVVVIALVFVLSSSPLGSKVYEKMSRDGGVTVPLHYYLSTKLGIFNIEVRPSWDSTLEIATNTFKENPVFGSGPNRFVNEIGS
jgi:hypothetical protein